MRSRLTLVGTALDGSGRQFTNGISIVDAHGGIVTPSNAPERGGLATVSIPGDLGTSRTELAPSGQ